MSQLRSIAAGYEVSTKEYVKAETVAQMLQKEQATIEVLGDEPFYGGHRQVVVAFKDGTFWRGAALHMKPLGEYHGYHTSHGHAFSGDFQRVERQTTELVKWAEFVA